MNADIIIPVYNQREPLLMTLEGFHKQIGNNKIHIIVVDDGSKERVPDIVDIFSNLDITYVYQENGGRSKARNTALKYAVADYIIFNDADRIPGKDFVEKHLRRLQETDSICIGSLKEIYFTNIEEHLQVIWDIVQNGGRLAREPGHSKNVDCLFDEFGKCMSVLPWIATYSGNMSMRRETFEKVGGFDENFKTWGFEHFEFGYRLHKSNVEFVREREAVNYHLAHGRDKSFYRESIVTSYEYFYGKYPTKEIELLKGYMLGEISLQEYEKMVAGEIKWENATTKELFIRLKD